MLMAQVLGFVFFFFHSSIVQVAKAGSAPNSNSRILAGGSLHITSTWLSKSPWASASSRPRDEVGRGAEQRARLAGPKGAHLASFSHKLHRTAREAEKCRLSVCPGKSKMVWQTRCLTCLSNNLVCEVWHCFPTVLFGLLSFSPSLWVMYLVFFPLMIHLEGYKTNRSHSFLGRNFQFYKTKQKHLNSWNMQEEITTLCKSCLLM